ncbi:hypothetical protein KFL_004820060 [Klebsormidium nitens]|uniref:Uncharacterized protein n=1 Tax=Klebsormidium nitens TaxID=105231 RepID=A0A1Y1IJW8_KLENI|nr:hypothetical protein KFL_004820060 [Klebsormidium nitens]|eukprot:GAQ89046.1 hypothetical protein KFL_004820060 [Klebsormidium nitens]
MAMDTYFGDEGAHELASRVGSFIRNGIMNHIPFDPVDFQHIMADLPDDEQRLAHIFLVHATETLTKGAEGRPPWAQQQLDDVIKWYFAVKSSGRQAKRKKYDQAAGQPSVVFRDRVAVGMMLVGCQDAATDETDIHVNYNCASSPAQGLCQPHPNARSREPGKDGWRDGMAAHERGLAVGFGKSEVMRRAESQSQERASVEQGRARHQSRTISERHDRARERSRSVSPWESEEEYRCSDRRSHHHVPHFSLDLRVRESDDDSPERRRSLLQSRQPGEKIRPSLSGRDKAAVAAGWQQPRRFAS